MRRLKAEHTLDEFLDSMAEDEEYQKRVAAMVSASRDLASKIPAEYREQLRSLLDKQEELLSWHLDRFANFVTWQ